MLKPARLQNGGPSIRRPNQRNVNFSKNLDGSFRIQVEGMPPVDLPPEQAFGAARWIFEQMGAKVEFKP